MIPQHFDHHKFPVQIQVVEILHLSKGFEKLIERSRNPSIYNLICWFAEPMGLCWVKGCSISTNLEGLFHFHLQGAGMLHCCLIKGTLKGNFVK